MLPEFFSPVKVLCNRPQDTPLAKSLYCSLYFKCQLDNISMTLLTNTSCCPPVEPRPEPASAGCRGACPDPLPLPPAGSEQPADAARGQADGDQHRAHEADPTAHGLSYCHS